MGTPNIRGGGEKTVRGGGGAGEAAGPLGKEVGGRDMTSLI